MSFSFSDSSPLPVGCQRWRNLLFHTLARARRGAASSRAASARPGSLRRSSLRLVSPVSRRRVSTTRDTTRARHSVSGDESTHVRASDGEAGIYFFSLDASSLLAVSAARLLYGLPYFSAAMSERTEEPRTEYSSRRRGARDAQLDMDEVLGAAAERARRHPRSFPDRAVQPVPPAW